MRRVPPGAGGVMRVEASLDLGMQVLAGVGLPYKGPKIGGLLPRFWRKGNVWIMCDCRRVLGADCSVKLRLAR
jgi:hypothetical protein